MTTRNPYAGKKMWVHASTANEAGDAPRPYLTNSGKVAFADSRLSDNSGEISAVSKKDLIAAQFALQKAVNERHYQETPVFASASNEKLDQVVTAAVQDRDGPAWKALGEVIGDEVAETMGREGFAHKTLLTKKLKKGEIGRIRIRKKDVLAFFATKNPEVIASQVRQFYAYPPEYYLQGRVLVEEAEIEQSSGDLLQDKYIDGMEAIARQRDLVWKRLVDASATAYNDSFLFNTLTPTVWASMSNQVMRWGIPVHMALMSFDLWPDVLADTEFSEWLDPVSKHAVVMDGYLGRIMGTEIHTDGYRYDTLKVLDPGEIYFLGAPGNLGAITLRKELSVAPINLHLLGRPDRGWYLLQIEGMTIVNPRAVVKGRKI